MRMFDDIQPNLAPAGADAYAGYVDGRWPDYDGMLATHPGAKYLAIDAVGTQHADCLDVEKGDSTPDHAPGWVKDWQRLNTPLPVIYMDASSMTDVVTAMTLAGYPRSSYLLWSAHYTDYSHICGPTTCGFPQANGTQWTDHGGIYDESLMGDEFWPAVIITPPDLTKDNPMFVALDTSTNFHWLVMAGQRYQVVDMPTVDELLKVCNQTAWVPCSPAFLAKFPAC